MLRDILDGTLAILVAILGLGIQLFFFGFLIFASLWVFLSVVGFCCP